MSSVLPCKIVSYLIGIVGLVSFFEQRPTSPLRLLYLPGMKETQKVLYVFGELGREYLGALWQHLETENIHHTMYAAFLCAMLLFVVFVCVTYHFCAFLFESRWMTFLS
jgi:hypothetical protein